MNMKQRSDYIEAAYTLRALANDNLRSGEHRPSAIHKARREMLHAADLIDSALEMEAAK